jgi:hypothetical protein
MTDLISELCQLTAEILKDNPQADLARLVALVKTNIDADLKLSEAIQDDRRLVQINKGDAQGFQTLVTGGIANIGIHLNDVNRETLQEVLREALEDLLKSLQPVGIPENIPRSGVTKFVGREDELLTLHNQLQQNKVVAISAIAGMGGVGKTELAIQYADLHQEDYQGGLCWLFARDVNIGIQIVSFAQAKIELKIPDWIDKIEDQVSFCWRNWRSGNVLIILDDVVNYPMIEPYLPPKDSRFKVLMTTRLKFGSPIQTIPLEVLSLENALELLESIIGKERIGKEPEIAETLCRWLEFLPLGLELVGRYLNEVPDLSLSTLLFRLQEKAKKRQALKHKALDVEKETRTSTAKLGVESAFNLSWDLLDELSQHLGKLLSLFANAPIPWELAERVEQKYYLTYPEKGEFDLDELELARAKLLRFHLCQNIDLQTYRLHSLIREFFRGKLEGEEDVTNIS